MSPRAWALIPVFKIRGSTDVKIFLATTYYSHHSSYVTHLFCSKESTKASMHLSAHNHIALEHLTVKLWKLSWSLAVWRRDALQRGKEAVRPSPWLMGWWGRHVTCPQMGFHVINRNNTTVRAGRCLWATEPKKTNEQQPSHGWGLWGKESLGPGRGRHI